MRWTVRLTATAVLTAILSGCAIFHARYDNAARLMRRPDFAAAKAAAPEWCRDALKTINDLEWKLEEQ